MIYKEKANNLALEHCVRLTGKLIRAVQTEARTKVAAQAYDTGRLYRSIKAEMRVYSLKVVGKVGSDVSYALVVHEGAKPHTISPRLKGGLKFFWPAGVGNPPLRTGRVVCFKGKVHHPGMRGRRYLILPLRVEAFKLGFKVVSGG